MKNCQYFELHYYLRDDSHDIEAIVRNTCESELIAIVNEIASTLDIDARILAEAAGEGGFRDFWKILSDNVGPLTP